jgi:hypothetical protein
VTPLQSCKHRLSLHGLVVDLNCEVPALNVPAFSALGEFTVAEWPDGFTPTTGAIRPYDETVVLRHLSPNAVAISDGSGMELYQDAERFWLIDDRWGLCEMNLLRSHWQSWILPQPSVEPMAIVEQAVMWPLAQLLRLKGLHLLPAVSVARDGFGFLIFCPFNMEPELTELVRHGFRTIGQRWTALREEDGRFAMLRMPGKLQRTPPPSLRTPAAPLDDMPNWVDLSEEVPGSVQHHGFCDSIIMVESGRRPLPRMKQLNRSNALTALRQSWPILELHPQRRHGQLPAKMAQQCACYHSQLSRRPQDLLYLLDQVQYGKTGAPAKVHVTVERHLRQVPA